MPFGLLVNRYMSKMERGDPSVVAFHNRMKIRLLRLWKRLMNKPLDI
jgi:hypothetical protein